MSYFITVNRLGIECLCSTHAALSLSGFFEEIIQALILHPLTPLVRSVALYALPDVLVRPCGRAAGERAGGCLAPVNINEIRQAGGEEPVHPY